MTSHQSIGGLSDVTVIDGTAQETPIDYLAVIFIISLLGFPVLTVPPHRAVKELRFGIQIIAPPGCESRLFAFGRMLENDLGFSHRASL